MENSGKEKPKAGEAIIRWTASQKKDFSKGMELMELSGYKPHVFKRLKDRGSGDPRAHRALHTELCNCLRNSRRAVREAQKAAEKAAPEGNPGTQDKQTPPQDTDEQVTGSIDSELQNAN